MGVAASDVVLAGHLCVECMLSRSVSIALLCLCSEWVCMFLLERLFQGGERDLRRLKRWGPLRNCARFPSFLIHVVGFCTHTNLLGSVTWQDGVKRSGSAVHAHEAACMLILTRLRARPMERRRIVFILVRS